jgi:hypothetical protein
VSTEAKIPANPAKGNLQGQTTLAAKIDRWQTLSTNLAPQIDQLPQFKDQFAQFQGVLSQALALHSQLKLLQGSTDDAMQQRDALFTQGDDLFTRLRHALKAVHGPQSGRLRSFGFKPEKTGRPRKTAPPPTPAPEAQAAQVAATAAPAEKQK